MTALLTPATGALAAVRAGRRRRTTRALVVTAVLAAVAFALLVVTMMVGSFPLSATEVIASVFRLTEDPSVDFIVLELRLPTALSGLTAGMALGASGTVFQQLLRNPLASPDFVGISSGASLAAVSSIVLWQLSGVGISGAALVGALVTALAMYLLAWKDGVSGYRFILIGIGIAALLEGLIGYLLTRASLYDAREAMHWLTGSVGQAGSREQTVLYAGVVVLLPVAMVLQRHLRVLELGDDAARALGNRAELSRFGLLAIAVVLVALATAVSGPIAFVALVAGPIANRLLGPAAGAIVPAALTGGVLLMAADLLAVHVLPTELPTGVVTGAVGAPYLLWLLATTNREGRGA